MSKISVKKWHFVLLIALLGLLTSIIISVKLFHIIFDNRNRKPKPNILIITLDTCRKDHLSIYGYKRETSPAIRSLAQDSFIFDNAYTVATNSGPSHATMFTGLYPYQHGLIDNGLKLSPKILTLAEFLSSRNYETFANVGFSVVGPESGLDQGFKTFKMEELDIHGHKEKSLEREMRGMNTTLSWLQKWHVEQTFNKSNGKSEQKPFFVWLHAQQIHNSYDPVPPYDNFFMKVPRKHNVEGFPNFNIRCRRDVGKAWRAGKLDQNLREQVIALYDGEIRMVDEYLKKIFDYLKAQKLYENTIIVILSDHGEVLLEYDDSSRGHTGLHYDAALRIPLIIKPSNFLPLKTGVHLEQMVSNVDLMPTLLELSGYQPFSWHEGRSLLGFMQNPKKIQKKRHIFFQEAPGNKKTIGMRTERWKLIEKRSKNQVHAILRDMVNDPKELKNAADDNPDKVKELGKVLNDWLSWQKIMKPSSYEDMSEKMKSQLIEAGYIREEK